MLEPSAELIAEGVGNTIGFVLGTSGSYTFSFTLYIAGSYKVKLTETSEGGGSSMPELDIYLTVVGALAAAPYTTVEGPGITDTIADTAAQRTIDIVAKDAYGNVAAGISLSDIEVSIDNNAAPMPTLSPFSFTGSPVFISNGVYRVTYAATMPGRYNLEVNVGGVAIDGGKKVSWNVQPAKPPALVSATLTFSLGSVVVKFDQATDQGGQTGTFACDVLLDAVTTAKIGAGGSCAWAAADGDAFVSLVIEMGYEATLVPKTARSAADSITLKADIIRTSAQNSWYASGGVFLDRPVGPGRYCPPRRPSRLDPRLSS